MNYPEKVLDLAREFVFRPVGFKWTPNEERVLRLVFTNLERRVFFMFGLPANVGATVLAMYSRIKNKRGLRGVFVDSFLPQFLATKFSVVEEEFGGNEAKFLKENKIANLGDFINHSLKTAVLFEDFCQAMADPEYMASFADSKKTRVFLKTWLDKYGHNSIARTANLWICCETISILTAKSLEWNRPGSGFIELSTRYVDMAGKDYYPIQMELQELYGVNPSIITSVVEKGFELYRELSGGDNFDGIFPNFLRGKYGHLYKDAPKDLEAGVIGETCDVLGNLLPCATLTSVGMSISGEALPKLLTHLILDNTPESLAIVEAIVEEILNTKMESRYTDRELGGLTGLECFLHQACSTKRGEFDKLPREFEVAAVLFQGMMSFRGWRDLQRQGFCTHFRSLVTPNLGFYRYYKPAPAELRNTFDKLYRYNYFL